MNPYKMPLPAYGVPTNLRELRSKLTYNCAYAPNRFPYLDFLLPDEQLTVEGEFWKMYQGLLATHDKKVICDNFKELKAVLHNAYTAYRADDRPRGLKLMHELEDIIYGPPES